MLVKFHVFSINTGRLVFFCLAQLFTHSNPREGFFAKMYQERRLRYGPIYLCIGFVFLFATSALTVSIIAATRKIATSTKTGTAGQFNLTASCVQNLSISTTPQIGAVFTLTQDGNAVVGKTPNTLAVGQAGVASLNAELTGSETDNQGKLTVYFDSQGQSGLLTIFVDFLITEQNGENVLLQNNCVSTLASS